METLEIGRADWRLKRLEVGPLMMNAYLLWSPAAGEVLLVDPGDEPERLLAEIDATGCRLTGLLCTHGHFDHVSAAAAVQERWDLPLTLHDGDRPFVENLDAVRASYGFPPVPTPRVAIYPGDAWDFAGETLDVIHAPGHCPGHVLLGLGDHVLVGDVIFRDSVGRTDLPGGDFDVLAASIRECLYVLDEETVLHPGHGPSTTVGYEMRSNPFVPYS